MSDITTMINLLPIQHDHLTSRVFTKSKDEKIIVCSWQIPVRHSYLCRDVLLKVCSLVLLLCLSSCIPHLLPGHS